MQSLWQNLLTLHSNINSLWCTPTLIASFTSVFSSFTSVNVGKLQYTAVSPLTTGNINPKHRRLRGPRCITKQTCVVTFNNKLIFDWLDGCRHCNQITLSFCCVLHRNQRTFQGLSLTFKDFSKWTMNLWTASTTLLTQNVITLSLVVVYMKKSRHPGHEIAPATVAVLATKIQKLVAMLANRTLQVPFILLLRTVQFHKAWR